MSTPILIQNLCDVHETMTGFRVVELVNPEADVVAVLGDISIGMRSVDLVVEAAETYPDIEFVAVMGNHDFYNGELDYIDYLQRLDVINSRLPNLHFLENEHVTIMKGDLTIFGGVGWSNMHGVDELARLELVDRIEDFHSVKVGGVMLTPDKLEELNEVFIMSALTTMRRVNSPKKIVVSHFPQSPKMGNANYPANSLSSFFAANRDSEIAELGRLGVSAMFSGHTHYETVKSVSGVALKSNYVGYRWELDDGAPRRVFQLYEV